MPTPQIRSLLLQAARALFGGTMPRSLCYGVLFTILSSILLTPMTTAAQKPGPVRHVVVFKYKKDAAPDKIAQVTRAFRDLKGKIPGITAFEDGINNSPEGKNLGFTHVYQLTFESVAARDAYLPHPEHKKFGELLGKLGVVEDVFVVDYVAGS
jgi:stress responsive alpha/beta barrel protein